MKLVRVDMEANRVRWNSNGNQCNFDREKWSLIGVQWSS